ncbi:hypothetical protein BDC45DRAFT_525997 [Circinella umbellata]|nr:hypothetical protein BDC45DRAFT_525997 [Circinella umbellata]
MKKKEYILPPKFSDGINGEQLAIEQGFEVYSYQNKDGHYEGKTWYRNIPRRVFEKYGKGMEMKGLPKGYALGGKADSTGRINRYIFGHPSKKTYRSSTEFGPHIIWLYQDKNKRKDCECHLCVYSSKKKIQVKPSKTENNHNHNEQQTKHKVNNKIRNVSYVYIESPPSRKDLPIPDYIDIPELTLPTHHCLS